MLKDACIELFLPWIQHSFMRRNIDFDQGFDPVSKFVILHVLPTIIIQTCAAFPAQLGIDSSPVVPSNVLRVKIQMSNNLGKVLEARLRFLFTIIPIPFSQQKRWLVGIWVVIVWGKSARWIWWWVYQVILRDVFVRIVMREAFCIVLSEKAKYVACRLEESFGRRCAHWGLLSWKYTWIRQWTIRYSLWRCWGKGCWRFRCYVMIALWQLAILTACPLFC